MVSLTSTPPNVILSNEPVFTVNLLETFIYELAVTSFLNLNLCAIKSCRLGFTGCGPEPIVSAEYPLPSS